MPDRPICDKHVTTPRLLRNTHFVPPKVGETFQIGLVSCMVRSNSIILTIPPHHPPLPAYWHDIHQDTFYVRRGKIQFTSLIDQFKNQLSVLHVEAIKPGKPSTPNVFPYEVPIEFENPFDEEAQLSFHSEPASYIDYFKILAEVCKEDPRMSRWKFDEVMGRYFGVSARKPLPSMDNQTNRLETIARAPEDSQSNGRENDRFGGLPEEERGPTEQAKREARRRKERNKKLKSESWITIRSIWQKGSKDYKENKLVQNPKGPETTFLEDLRSPVRLRSREHPRYSWY